MSKIKVTFKKPNMNHNIVEIDYSLDRLQELIEGRIEYSVFSERLKIDIIFNEEYLISGLKPNLNLGSPYLGGVLN